MFETDGFSDEELVQRVLAGEREVFGKLILRHERNIRSMIIRHVGVNDADDVTQAAFVEVYRSLPSFRGESSFKTWMTRIALRRCYRVWQKRKRNRESAFSELTHLESNRVDESIDKVSAEKHSRDERQQLAKGLLAEALKELTPEDRMIVTLSLLEDRPIEDLAKVLGWSSVRVRVRLHRMKQRLRTIIEKLL